MHNRDERDLLERDLELATIDAVLAAARRGRGALAVIEGPAGIGKTRLVEATVERAASSGLTVFSATGSPIESDLAFGVARQLFELPLAALAARQRKRVLAGVAGRATLVLGVEQGEGRPVTPESAFAASHVLFWLTANLAGRTGALIAVDDAHWADLASLRFLHFLARRVVDLPVAVVVATRPPGSAGPGTPAAGSAETGSPGSAGTGRPGTESAGTGAGDVQATLSSLIEQGGTPVQPAPLSTDAVAQLVRRQLAGEPEPRFVEACARATNGNVLLLTELLRSLQARGVEPTAAAASEVLSVAPGAVRRRVATQLAALAPETTALAEALAVLGEASIPHAASLAGIDLDAARRSARALEDALLLAPGRPLRFQHPMIAAAVLAGIAPSELADAHRRAARLLAEQGASADAAAGHLLRAEPAGDAWALGVLRQAAAMAIDRGAPEAAVSFLRRAAEEEPSSAGRAGLLLDLGRAETSAGLLTEAIATLRLGLDAGPDPATDAALAIASSQAFDVSCDYEGSMAALDAARRRLGEEAVEERAAIDRQLVAQALLDPRWRLAVAERVASWQRAARDGTLEDPAMQAIACGAAILAGLASSEWLAPLRAAASDPRLRPYASLDDANSWAHHLTVMALDCTDCLEEANGYLDYALTESRRRGDAAIAVVFLAFRARVAFRTGAVADGDSWCRIADELTIGPEAFTAVPFVLCDVLAEQGRGDDAEQMMQAYPNVSAPQHTAVYDLMCGRAALAAGHDEEALEALLRAGEILEALELRHPNFVPWRAYAVAAARGCGRLDLARRLAEEDLAISRRTESTSALGRALRSCALVDEDRSSARNLLEESCAVLAQSPARLDEAYSIVELGALLRADDPALARDVLRQGLDLAVRCDASALVERARRELVAAGGRPRRLVTSGIDALTPSERQVARMAGEGMTNREIAQALFVTLKTVEHHLGSTYDKLAISGRRALAGALQVAGGAGG